jgi:predicted amidohydrolase
MENTVVACVQQRMRIVESQEDLESEARRFLHQARAKSAQLVLFPELAGLMLVSPLASRFKVGLMKRADEANRPTAGLLSRGLGRVSEAAADLLGGGFRGSLVRLLEKNSAALLDLYLETFGKLAREFGTAIVAGSLYLRDEETATIRNRAYVLDADGHVLGYQDKLNLSPDEGNLAVPGSELHAIDTPFGRLGLLMGRDILYPELARLLAIQGAELLAGIVACPGAAQAAVLRQALALRAEENQVFAAGSFLLGPNYLGPDHRDEYVGQSALLAPISLTAKGNGILLQAGSNRTQGFIAAELDAEALHALWETSRFRPRREMHLGSLAPILGEMYERGLTIEQALTANLAGVPEITPTPPPEWEWETEKVEPEEIGAPPAEAEIAEPETFVEPEPEAVAPEAEAMAPEPEDRAQPAPPAEEGEPPEPEAVTEIEEITHAETETEPGEPEAMPAQEAQPPAWIEPLPATEDWAEEAEAKEGAELDEAGSASVAKAWSRFRRGKAKDS